MAATYTAFVAWVRSSTVITPLTRSGPMSDRHSSCSEMTSTTACSRSTDGRAGALAAPSGIGTSFRQTSCLVGNRIYQGIPMICCGRGWGIRRPAKGTVSQMQASEKWGHSTTEVSFTCSVGGSRFRGATGTRGRKVRRSGSNHPAIHQCLRRATCILVPA